MHARFTERAESVVQLADSIAREYEQDYVGTEHVLLAIRREGTGVGSRLLEQRGISEAMVREQIDRFIKKSMEDTWVFGRLPGSPHFRNVVAQAVEFAGKLGKSKVCTEHLLLALLKETGSVAFNALDALGVTFDQVYDEAVRHTGT